VDGGGKRARQRSETKARIAEAATTRFAMLGFDRTSIRDVAADAGVDPKLVMHYFGSKDGLYALAVQPSADSQAEPVGDDAVEAALASLMAKIGDPEQRTIAQMRSMLTHPDSSQAAQEAFESQASALAGSMDGNDAELRASLMLAANLGVAMARQILGVSSLAEASVADISAVLRRAYEEVARSA
jgi:AcrR family transcriptional regulator